MGGGVCEGMSVEKGSSESTMKVEHIRTMCTQSHTFAVLHPHLPSTLPVHSISLVSRQYVVTPSNLQAVINIALNIGLNLHLMNMWM